ncbi:MAG: adenylosuccinate synthetase, partial [Cyanobacteria bacterium P01_D01_bin.6]
VVTLWHKIINRAQELHRGDRRFGSTGMGVGATFIYARSHPNTTLTAWDLVDHRRLSEKVDALYDYVQEKLQPLAELPKVAQYLNEESAWLDPKRVMDALVKVGQRLAPCILNAEAAEAYLEQCLLSGNTVLEGAQGTLLDYQVGTVPHITQSTTRCCAAAQLLQPYAQQIGITYIGISRPYAHRHGAGPLPTEDSTLEPYLRDRHNLENRWQGGLRVGWFDAELAAYAKQVNPELNYLVITNLDRLATCPSIAIGTRYANQRRSPELLTDFLFRATPIYESVGLKDVTARVQAAYETPLLAVSAGEENAWTEMIKLDAV